MLAVHVSRDCMRRWLQARRYSTHLPVNLQSEIIPLTTADDDGPTSLTLTLESAFFVYRNKLVGDYR